MEATHFQIRFSSPMKMQLQPSNLHIDCQPRYRVLSLDCRRDQGEEFTLEMLIHTDDLDGDAPVIELQSFRDSVVSMLAALAAVSLTLLSKGTFTFPVGKKKYKVLSLGAMSLDGAPEFVGEMRPLILAPSLPETVRTGNYFLWQAMSTREPLFRFINLAIICELLASHESDAPKSMAPSCPNCKVSKSPCADCGHTWTIPTPLSSRLGHVIPDDDLRRRFNRMRNKVFHGGASRADKEMRADLISLSADLLLALRNHLVASVDVEPITMDTLNVRFSIGDVMMAVYYTVDDITKAPCHITDYLA